MTHLPAIYCSEGECSATPCDNHSPVSIPNESRKRKRKQDKEARTLEDLDRDECMTLRDDFLKQYKDAAKYGKMKLRFSACQFAKDHDVTPDTVIKIINHDKWHVTRGLTADFSNGRVIRNFNKGADPRLEEMIIAIQESAYGLLSIRDIASLLPVYFPNDNVYARTTVNTAIDRMKNQGRYRDRVDVALIPDEKNRRLNFVKENVLCCIEKDKKNSEELICDSVDDAVTDTESIGTMESVQDQEDDIASNLILGASQDRDEDRVVRVEVLTSEEFFSSLLPCLTMEDDNDDVVTDIGSNKTAESIQDRGNNSASNQNFCAASNRDADGVLFHEASSEERYSCLPSLSITRERVDSLSYQENDDHLLLREALNNDSLFSSMLAEDFMDYTF